MQIELSKHQVEPDSKYWMESAAFWMEMYIRVKKELDSYNAPKHVVSNPKLRIVCRRD